MKYEYKVVQANTDIETKLNLEGKKGWELINFQFPYFVFMREVDNGDKQKVKKTGRKIQPLRNKK